MSNKSRLDRISYPIDNGYPLESVPAFFSIVERKMMPGEGIVTLRKLSYDEVKLHFEERSFKLLSKEYKNAHTPLKYECPKGHIGETRWSNFSQGSGCAECYGTKRKDHYVIEEAFRKRNYTLLSEYVNGRVKMMFICDKGHKWAIAWDDFRGGHGCGVCEKERRSLTGNKHWKWDSSLTDEERSLHRKYTSYYFWRKAVFKRDNYTCQCCSERSGEGNWVIINAHHLESYHANKSLRTDLNNGITLCKKCHKDFHKKYGQKYNTRKQFEEWFATKTQTSELTA